MQQVTLSNNYPQLVNNNYTTGPIAKAGLLQRFMTWCSTQEENRLLWLGIAVLGGIATVLPLTLIAVVFLANNSLTLWAITCTLNVLILVVNLAAQPAKVTLPVLFFVWFINAIIILYSLAVFLAIV